MQPRLWALKRRSSLTEVAFRQLARAILANTEQQGCHAQRNRRCDRERFANLLRIAKQVIGHGPGDGRGNTQTDNVRNRDEHRAGRRPGNAVYL